MADHLLVDNEQAPFITVEQMREVDRLMVEVFDIPLSAMMESAGRLLAELACRMLGGRMRGRTVAVAVGKGNNGGGGLVAARYAHGLGANVAVLAEDESFSKTPLAQWSKLAGLDLEVKTGLSAPDYVREACPDLIVDALIGYGLTGTPRGWIAKMIGTINDIPRLKIALDVPSGLNATTGEVMNPCVQASATMTLALPKTGLDHKHARGVTGALYLADIGVPIELYKQIGIDAAPSFSTGALHALRRERSI